MSESTGGPEIRFVQEHLGCRIRHHSRSVGTVAGWYIFLDDNRPVIALLPDHERGRWATLNDFLEHALQTQAHAWYAHGLTCIEHVEKNGGQLMPEESKPENQKVVEAFKISATRVGAGTEIYLKSPRMEKLMKALSNEQIQAGALFDGRRDMYAVQAQTLTTPEGSIVFNQPGRSLSYGGFNPAYLAVVGIGEGTTITIAHPMSNTMIKAIIDQAKIIIPQILREFAKPIEATLVVTELELQTPSAA